ncbi:MAG: putative signal transduction histidine kinase [Ilumatobacteraceae bacterium]|nr:putative signal transduction histidine kinase [Ilumatobacteraceae bacterium]
MESNGVRPIQPPSATRNGARDPGDIPLVNAAKAMTPAELRRLLAAVMSLASDLDLGVILRRLIETAVDLVDAEYGALGVLDATRTDLSDFITVGIDDDVRAAIGDLPKGHGILGLLIDDPQPLRLPDLHAHPATSGFPPHHPPMTSFLGVPVFVRGQAYGYLYLTDKHGTGGFTDVDEELAVALAAATGTAIDKSRLHDRVRELDVIEDRSRIARDLHDTVIQRLFATGLSLQSAARLAAPLPEVVDRIQDAVDELDLVVREVRSSIFELHAVAAAADGLRRLLLAVGDELAEALGYEPSFHFEGPIDVALPDHIAAHLIAVVREALANIARHARSATASVRVVVERGVLTATVDDEGIGLGERRPSGNGLGNLASRAEQLGGGSLMTTRDGGGTRVCWWVPIDAPDLVGAGAGSS